MAYGGFLPRRRVAPINLPKFPETPRQVEKLSNKKLVVIVGVDFCCFLTSLLVCFLLADEILLVVFYS